MKIINCACGLKLEAPYSSSFVSESYPLTRWWYWWCSSCGQPYKEQVKESIILQPDKPKK